MAEHILFSFRAVLIPVAVISLLGSPASAQVDFDALAFSMCKKIAADTARLKCFDEIGAQQDQGKTETTATEPAKWEYETDKSPIDDSPQVSASLKGAGNTLLVLRCKERLTEAAFVPGQYFVNGSGNNVPAIVRLNEDSPVRTTWSASTNGSAAFAPRAIDFIRSLPDGGKLFIRITGFQGRTADGLFQLADVSTARAKIEEACHWSTPKADRVETAIKKQAAKPRPAKQTSGPLVLPGH